MGRCVASLVALSVAFRVCASALGEAQAGEPMAVNVDYTVPVYSAKDVAVLAQGGAASEAGLHAKSSLRAGYLSDLPFAALSTDAGAGGAGSRKTVVTVHVPSPAGAAAALVADARAGAALLEQLAKAQDSQEQRFLDAAGGLTARVRHAGGA